MGEIHTSRKEDLHYRSFVVGVDPRHLASDLDRQDPLTTAEGMVLLATREQETHPCVEMPPVDRTSPQSHTTTTLEAEHEDI